MGWSSVTGTSVTEERIGEYHLKGQVQSDALDNDEFICYELCDEHLGDSFTGKGGLTQWRAIGFKDGYSIAANTFKQLNSARYMGRFFPSENSVVNLYMRDGKPLAVAWCTKLDETYDYTFKGDNISILDYNGNPVENEGNTVTLIKQPYFITGISEEMLDMAVREDIKTKIDSFTELFGEKADVTAVKNLKPHVENTASFNESAITSFVNDCYGYGDALLDGFGENCGYTVNELALMLDKISDIGKRAALLYGKYEKTGIPVSGKQIAELRAKSLEIRGNDPYVGQPLTSRMLLRAKQYGERSEYESKISVYKGMARADAVISQKIAGWAEKFMNVEPGNDAMGLIAYTDTRTVKVYQEAKTDIGITIDNRLLHDVSGTVGVFDDEGNPAGVKIENVTLKAGEKTEITVPFSVGRGAKVGKSCYHIKLTDSDGNVMTDQAITTEVLSMVNIKLLPSYVTYDKLNAVEVSVENISDGAFDAQISLEAPEGWKLENPTADVHAEQGETVVLKYNVTKKTPAAFNEYSFKLVGKTKENIELVNEICPLDFAVIVKSDKAIDVDSFDGDITDWANAYPVHAGAPRDGSDAAAWQRSNNALRVLTKWDSNYIYFMCDAYDGHQIQLFTGGNTWQGDSIQLAFDPLLNGIDTDGSIIDHYQADDTEYCFAKLGTGEDAAYNGRAAEGIETGDRGGYVKIIRSDEQNITRCLIRVPVSDILLKPAVNEKFGWNAVLNDADTLTRERYVQVTRGTGDYKAPGHYYTFTCLPSEKAKVPAASSKDYVIKLSE